MIFKPADYSEAITSAINIFFRKNSNFSRLEKPFEFNSKFEHPIDEVLELHGQISAYYFLPNKYEAKFGSWYYWVDISIEISEDNKLVFSCLDGKISQSPVYR